jgi:IS605 OrfB family transposase
VYLDDKNMYKNIHDLMFETRHILNKTICAMYEWDDFKFDYKEKNEVYPKPKDILYKKNNIDTYKSLAGYIDYNLRSKFYKNISNNSSSAIQNAIKLYKTKVKDMQRGLCTLPHYSKFDKIILHNRSVRIRKEDDKYFFDISLFSTKFKKELELKSGIVLFNAVVKDNYLKCIVDRLLSGEYKINESKLTYDKKKKKFYIILGYGFEKAENIERTNIMGINLRVIDYAVYAAIHNSKIRFKIHGGEIEAFRNQIEKRRLSLRKQRITCNNNKRGRNRMLRPVVKIGNIISNFKNLINHNYSKTIIGFAIKNDVKEIRMEDLSGISIKNNFLKNWSYYDLQQKIKYKAENNNIKFTLINPKNTTISCNKCGYVDKKNRNNRKNFICTKCGYHVILDYNAALNIANKDFRADSAALR